jgi:mono/diheme cytochrome c family protein
MAIEQGNASAGQQFAQAQCAQCHAVGKGDDHSPNQAAPPFSDIAAAPGLTAMAIHVWLRSPHRNMPNIHLGDEDKDNVVAYLLSLRPDERRADVKR